MGLSSIYFRENPGIIPLTSPRRNDRDTGSGRLSCYPVALGSAFFDAFFRFGLLCFGSGLTFSTSGITSSNFMGYRLSRFGLFFIEMNQWQFVAFDPC